MIILNTTYSVKTAMQDQWIAWMKSEYFDFLDSTNLVTDKIFSRVMVGEQSGSFSYSVQLRLASPMDYQQFEKEYLSIGERKLAKKFGEDVLAFSTLLKVI